MYWSDFHLCTVLNTIETCSRHHMSWRWVLDKITFQGQLALSGFLHYLFPSFLAQVCPLNSVLYLVSFGWYFLFIVVFNFLSYQALASLSIKELKFRLIFHVDHFVSNLTDLARLFLLDRLLDIYDIWSDTRIEI